MALSATVWSATVWSVAAGFGAMDLPVVVSIKTANFQKEHHTLMSLA